MQLVYFDPTKPPPEYDLVDQILRLTSIGCTVELIPKSAPYGVKHLLCLVKRPDGYPIAKMFWSGTANKKTLAAFLRRAYTYARALP